MGIERGSLVHLIPASVKLPRPEVGVCAILFRSHLLSCRLLLSVHLHAWRRQPQWRTLRLALLNYRRNNAERARW
jgi:hypothetical protein